MNLEQVVLVGEDDRNVFIPRLWISDDELFDMWCQSIQKGGDNWSTFLETIVLRSGDDDWCTMAFHNKDALDEQLAYWKPSDDAPVEHRAAFLRNKAAAISPDIYYRLLNIRKSIENVGVIYGNRTSILPPLPFGAMPIIDYKVDDIQSNVAGLLYGQWCDALEEICDPDHKQWDDEQDG